MYEITILLTLAGVHFIALMSPGPDFALVIQNATRYGRKTGLFIALGLSCGILTHSILSITGISYLIHLHPALFTLLQIAGSSYLLYLGIGALISLYTSHKENTPAAHSKQLLVLHNKKQAFFRGYTTNILNPKALIFFISLMSGLVPADMSMFSKSAAVFILWFLSLLWFSFLAWALSASRIQRALLGSAPYIDSICALIFISIGSTILWHCLYPILTTF